MDATSDDIRAAWRKQMLLWHPDRHTGPAARSRVQVLNEARNILLDPVTRRAYDRTLTLLLSLESERSRLEGSAAGKATSTGGRPSSYGHSNSGVKWAYARSGYASRRTPATGPARRGSDQPASEGTPPASGLEARLRQAGAWLAQPFTRYRSLGITHFATQALLRVAGLGAAGWLLWVIAPFVIRAVVVLTLAVASILALVALAGLLGTIVTPRSRKRGRSS